MAFETLKENVLDTDANIHRYLKAGEDYIKLQSFKALMIGITYMAKIMIIGALACVALLITSFAIAFKLAQVLQNTFYGFLIVGLFYVLVVVLLYLFRAKLNAPIIRKFSNYYFTRDDTKTL